MQLTETASGNEYVAEIEDGDETHHVTLHYSAPTPDARYRYAEATADADANATVMKAALRLCLDCTDEITGLTGPDGEPVEWANGEKLVEQFEAASPDHAREFILQQLGASYAESDQLIIDYHLDILDVDRLDEAEENLSETKSDAA